jgi:hypothetical protein
MHLHVCSMFIQIVILSQTRILIEEGITHFYFVLRVNSKQFYLNFESILFNISVNF